MFSRHILNDVLGSFACEFVRVETYDHLFILELDVNSAVELSVCLLESLVQSFVLLLDGAQL